MFQEIKNKIAFVVVLYNQKFEDTNVYNSLLKNITCKNIYIWDNSESVDINSHLFNEFGAYIYSSRNLGVSYAYNRAAEYAKAEGYEWIVLLDQDTTFSDCFLDELIKVTKENPMIKLICPKHKLNNGLYLSPAKHKLLSPCLSKIAPPNKIEISKYAIINSGLAISLDLFFEVGGYNEKVFLDYSDFQFIDRCCKKEKYAHCLNSICIQDFSDEIKDKHKLLVRFTLFCRSLKGFETTIPYTYIKYNFSAIKRCISLSIRLKSWEPIKIFYINYVK